MAAKGGKGGKGVTRAEESFLLVYVYMRVVVVLTLGEPTLTSGVYLHSSRIRHILRQAFLRNANQRLYFDADFCFLLLLRPWNVSHFL